MDQSSTKREKKEIKATRRKEKSMGEQQSMAKGGFRIAV